MTSASTTSPRTDAGLAKLQRNLGYEFGDLELLKLALTHKSFAKQNNERLEFVGDAVLGYLVGDMLYQVERHYSEDILSLMRASLVRGSALAEVAQEVELAPCLSLGSGERKSGGRKRESILADAFEAVVGAVHEDGGIEACRGLVQRLFAHRVEQLDPDNLKDPKTRLQEWIQASQLALPSYDVLEVSGADHQRVFTVVCRVPQRGLELQATASSRRAAEQAAAALVLEQLNAKEA